MFPCSDPVGTRFQNSLRYWHVRSGFFAQTELLNSADACHEPRRPSHPAHETFRWWKIWSIESLVRFFALLPLPQASIPYISPLTVLAEKPRAGISDVQPAQRSTSMLYLLGFFSTFSFSNDSPNFSYLSLFASAISDLSTPHCPIILDPIGLAPLFRGKRKGRAARQQCPGHVRATAQRPVVLFSHCPTDH